MAFCLLMMGCSSELEISESELNDQLIKEAQELYAKKSQLIFEAKKGVYDTIMTYPESSFDSLEGAELLSARIYLFNTTALDEEVKFVSKMERLKVKEIYIRSFIDSLNQKDTLLKAMELEFIQTNKLDTTLYPYEN